MTNTAHAMSKEFKGVWIPRAIYNNPKLAPTDKLILSDIYNLCNSSNKYFKANDTISEEVGVSIRTVSRSVTYLIKLGYITTYYDGRVRVVNMTKALDKMARALDKLARQPRQNGFADKPKRLTSIQESIQPSIHISKGVVYPYNEKEFLDAWSIWLGERKAKKLRKYTELGEQTALHNLQKISNNDFNKAILIINNSITHGWQGLFALKEPKNRSFTTTQDTIDWINKKR